jgi:hypothetical protein
LDKRTAPFSSLTLGRIYINKKSAIQQSNIKALMATGLQAHDPEYNNKKAEKELKHDLKHDEHQIKQDVHHVNRKLNSYVAKDSKYPAGDRAKAAGNAVTEGAKEIVEDAKKQFHKT